MVDFEIIDRTVRGDLATDIGYGSAGQESPGERLGREVHRDLEAGPERRVEDLRRRVQRVRTGRGGRVSESAFAIVYAVLWGVLFAWLFRLDRKSKRLGDDPEIKRNLHSGWPDPE